MDYSIDGLTPKQKLLMEIIWSIDSEQQLKQFLKSLPEQDRVDAEGLIICAFHEVLEDHMEMFEQQGYPDALKVIKRVKHRKI